MTDNSASAFDISPSGGLTDLFQRFDPTQPPISPSVLEPISPDSSFTNVLMHMAMGGDPDDLAPSEQHIAPHASLADAQTTATPPIDETLGCFEKSVKPCLELTTASYRSPQYSTSAGAYQFNKGTWDDTAKVLGLGDFQPVSQDLAAAYWLKKLGATDKLAAGDVAGAMHAAGARWQIFPQAGGKAIAAKGQQPHTPAIAPLMKAYNDKLGRLQ